jgi:hypothetical protein
MESWIFLYHGNDSVILHANTSFKVIIIIGILNPLQMPSGVNTSKYIKIPLVSNPIHRRYRESFLEMYVFPLAGSPTRAMHIFELIMGGLVGAERERK